MHCAASRAPLGVSLSSQSRLTMANQTRMWDRRSVELARSSTWPRKNGGAVSTVTVNLVLQLVRTASELAKGSHWHWQCCQFRIHVTSNIMSTHDPLWQRATFQEATDTALNRNRRGTLQYKRSVWRSEAFRTPSAAAHTPSTASSSRVVR